MSRAAETPDGMRLRAATEDDDEAIRGVIAAAFPDNPKRRADITAWQYWSNPFGSTCVWVWDDDGAVAATYANFPMPAVFAGEPRLAGNGVDAAVDPAYQGRGLFEPLARALYADSRTHGMVMTLCFINNPLAIRGTTKAGWLEVGRLGVWVLPVDDAWLARRTHLPTPVARVARRMLTRSPRADGADIGDAVPSGIDRLWADAGGVTTGVVRGQAWWDWRYGAHPDHPYTFLSARRGDRLRGAAVATTRDAFGGRFVYLLELIAEDDIAAAAVAAAASEHARSIGAAGVAVLALPDTRIAARARGAGFRRVPQRLEPKPTSFGVVPNDPAYAHLQSQRWSVSWGDLDHV
ncbi:MAG: GNAT family N-acetyltransferase [Acidimicrobiales bacterium]